MTNHWPVAGAYFTDFGVLDIELQGDHVEGTYSYQNGRISGTLREHRIEGSWVQTGNHVQGSF